MGFSWNHLERGSSPVDWCEPNNIITENIAEFVNTISNVLFFIMPPVLIFLFKDFGKCITTGVSKFYIFDSLLGE